MGYFQPLAHFTIYYFSNFAFYFFNHVGEELSRKQKTTSARPFRFYHRGMEEMTDLATWHTLIHETRKCNVLEKFDLNRVRVLLTCPFRFFGFLVFGFKSRSMLCAPPPLPYITRSVATAMASCQILTLPILTQFCFIKSF